MMILIVTALHTAPILCVIFSHTGFLRRGKCPLFFTIDDSGHLKFLPLVIFSLECLCRSMYNRRNAAALIDLLVGYLIQQVLDGSANIPCIFSPICKQGQLVLGKGGISDTIHKMANPHSWITSDIICLLGKCKQGLVSLLVLLNMSGNHKPLAQSNVLEVQDFVLQLHSKHILGPLSEIVIINFPQSSAKNRMGVISIHIILGPSFLQ